MKTQRRGRMVGGLTAAALCATMGVGAATAPAQALDSAGLRANAAKIAAAQTVAYGRAPLSTTQKKAVIKKIPNRSNDGVFASGACGQSVSGYYMQRPVQLQVRGRVYGGKYNYSIGVTQRSDFGGKNLSYIIGSMQHWGKIYVNGKAVNLPRQPESSSAANVYLYKANRPVQSIGAGWNVYVYSDDYRSYQFVREVTCTLKYS